MGSNALVASLTTPVRLAEISGALALVLFLYAALVTVERRGYHTELLTVIVGLIAFESIMWSQDAVPVGIFHPKLAGQNFRLYDVLIPIALLARLRVRGLPRRVSALGAVVFVFCFWYMCEAVIGVMRGYGLNNVLFEAKLVIYVGGAYVLAAGVRAEDILGDHGIRRLARPLAVVTLVLLALTASGGGINIPVPTLNVTGLAGVQPDAATLFLGLGVITLLVELASPRRRPTMVAAGIVLMLSALGSSQRAALVALAAGAAFAAVGWLVPVNRKRRIRLTPTEVLGTATVLAGGTAAYPLLTGASNWDLSNLPLASLLSRTFTSTGKAQSAADRVAQYHAALPDVMKHLVLGWGLAIPTTYIAIGKTVVTQSPDDVYLSIVLRTGLFGLLLFAALAVAAIVVVARVFQDHPDSKVAALAWGCGTIVVAILARGSVEGIFEKYRLAIELGLALGMAQSAMASLARRKPPAWSAVANAPPGTEPQERSNDQLAAFGASAPQ